MRERLEEQYPDLDLDAEKARFLSLIHLPLAEIAKQMKLTPALVRYYCQ